MWHFWLRAELVKWPFLHCFSTVRACKKIQKLAPLETPSSSRLKIERTLPQCLSHCRRFSFLSFGGATNRQHKVFAEDQKNWPTDLSPGQFESTISRCCKQIRAKKNKSTWVLADRQGLPQARVVMELTPTLKMLWRAFFLNCEPFLCAFRKRFKKEEKNCEPIFRLNDEKVHNCWCFCICKPFRKGHCSCSIHSTFFHHQPFVRGSSQRNHDGGLFHVQTFLFLCRTDQNLWTHVQNQSTQFARRMESWSNWSCNDASSYKVVHGHTDCNLVELDWFF